MTDHSPDLDDLEIDPDVLVTLELVAAALVDAARDFTVAVGGDLSRHPAWSAMGRLDRNLATAGVIELCRTHRRLLAELLAVAADLGDRP